MSDPLNPDSSRDTLVFLIELGGIAVVVGAGVIYGLRKAFTYTDAFENEAPKAPPPPAGTGSSVVFPEPPPGGAPPPPKPPEPGSPGPTVRANRLT